MTPPPVRAHGAEALPGFIELVEEAGAWLHARGIPQWPPGSNRAQAPLLRRWLADGALLLVGDAGDPDAGCLVTEQGYAAWEGRAGRAAYLHKLAVARRAAGCGLGAGVVAAAEAWARSRGLARVRLDCWDGSAPLRAFYGALGYRELEAVTEHGYLVRLFEKALDAVVGSAP